MAIWRSADGRARHRGRDGGSGSLCRATGGSQRLGSSRRAGCRDDCRGCTVIPASRRAGFTLIEVLVALAIVSIALLAALRAAGQGTSNVDALRARLLAGWVAENVLAEQRARGDWPPLGLARGTQRQAGIEFAWREEVVATPNARFRRVELRVYAAPGEGHELSHLTGFVVNPPAPTP